MPKGLQISTFSSLVLLFYCPKAGKKAGGDTDEMNSFKLHLASLAGRKHGPLTSPERSRQAKHLRALSQGISLQVCCWPANWKTYCVYSPTFVFLLIFCTVSHHHSFWRFLISSIASSWRLPVWGYHGWAIFQSSQVLEICVYIYLFIYIYIYKDRVCVYTYG